MEHPIAEGEPVQALYRHEGFIIVRHRDKTESLAFLGLEVPYHLNTLYCTKRAEQLPEDIFLRLRSEVVYKYTPAGSRYCIIWGGGCRWQYSTGTQQAAL